MDSGPYLPSIGLGLIGLTVYISYSVTLVARSSFIFYTFYQNHYLYSYPLIIPAILPRVRVYLKLSLGMEYIIISSKGVVERIVIL